MEKRSEREQKFHDERFLDGVGARSQDKYYSAISSARKLLDNEVARCAQRDVVGLELGCGTGENLESLLNVHLFHAYGIDISPVAVLAARSRLRNYDPIPRLEVMDANYLSYDDEMFDFCFGSGVLHHLNLPDSIYELRRVLKKGGNFLFLEPLATNPLISIYRRLTPADRSIDETPLTNAHLDQIKNAFPGVKFGFFGFFSLGGFLFNKWPNIQKVILFILTYLDKALFLIPGAWRLSWVVVINGRRD